MFLAARKSRTLELLAFDLKKKSTFKFCVISTYEASLDIYAEIKPEKIKSGLVSKS
jgi:hypothetical protein